MSARILLRVLLLTLFPAMATRLLAQPAAAPPVARSDAATADEQSAATEWVELFDGKTLEGWQRQGGTATYRVEDGAIVGTTAEGSPNTFLCTKRDYANFELMLEVHCEPALNSGIQVRSHVYTDDTPQESNPNRIRKAGEVYGYQCEIANNGTAGKFWDEGRRTLWLDDAKGDLGEDHPYKPGQWNEYRILCQGNRLQCWVNGVARGDFTDDRDASGFIGLQVHGIRKDAGPYEVRWRNIRLREFSINPGINSSFVDPAAEEFVERFEREGREVYDRRQQIVEFCRLQPGMVVADIGCGTGLFTRLLSSEVGAEGRVMAVDIARNFVQHVESTCREQGLTNVEGVVCTAEDVNLPANSIDLAFICDTYHHFEFPQRTMRSIHRALKPNGRVVLVDFERIPGESSDWIMSHVRAGKETFVAEVTQSGFTPGREAPFLNENYLVVFRKAAQRPRQSEVRESTPMGVQVTRDVPYREGNPAWKLDLYQPGDAAQGLRPAIVVVHGGGWRGGDKAAGNFASLAERFAGKGYVCISVNYRLTGEAPFPACVEDVKCAVRWLRANAKDYKVDPARIGAYGNSAGAHLVSMLGLVGPDAGLEGDGPYQDQSSLVQAVCPCATPTDFTEWEQQGSYNSAVLPLLAGPEESLQERAKAASPFTYVHAQAPPFLVIHGGRDTTVNVAQADRFVEALQKAGAPDVTYLRYDEAGHGVFNQHAEETISALEAYFDRTLRRGQ